jgi:glycosyltransferase involved in cell wall biosynthesis
MCTHQTLQPADRKPRGKVLYLATEDWYFCAHRLPMARAARNAGWDVIVATRVQNHGTRITDEGFRLVPMPWRRRGGGVARELWAILFFMRLVRLENPELVHSIALKPLVYGGIGARLAGARARVGTVAGLGFIFSSRRLKARILRQFMRVLLRFATGGHNSLVTLENPDDGVVLDRIGAVIPKRMVLVRGSGVDIDRFHPTAEPDGVPVIGMACRLIRGKGVATVIEAARLLKRRGIVCRFRLAGTIDPESQESHTQAEIDSWVAEGLIEWTGWIDDVPGFWQSCHIAVYPSTYGEGVPRTSIEAMACGKPLVTTDMPGCRETVEQGVNGFLVPRDAAEAVADCLATLIADAPLRHRMGTASRCKAAAEFSDADFVARTLAIYDQALGSV